MTIVAVQRRANNFHRMTCTVDAGVGNDFPAIADAMIVAFKPAGNAVGGNGRCNLCRGVARYNALDFNAEKLWSGINIWQFLLLVSNS